MTQNEETATVYYDGSCPLCRLEIGHYQRKDVDGQISFVDVSQPEPELGDGLTRDKAMARLHVKLGNGQMVSGAAAFAAIWQRVPSWRWAARIASIPGVLTLLEAGYRLFLPIRPWISRPFRRLYGPHSERH
jgi:predicted DCC family thiol-disulfide oxidoreductase YuxK